MPPRANPGLGLRRVRLVSGLLHQIVELDLRLRPFQSARVPHDLLVGVAVAIGLDRGFALPFRVRDEFGRVSAAQELFRKAALLLEPARSGAGLRPTRRSVHALTTKPPGHPRSLASAHASDRGRPKRPTRPDHPWGCWIFAGRARQSRSDYSVHLND